MDWAISLIIKSHEQIEERLKPILRYLFEVNEFSKCILSDFDGTGELGNLLSLRMNEEVTLLSNEKEILSTLEDGQILELDLELINHIKYKIIVRTGSVIDILGTGDLIPLTITGDYVRMDLELYNIY